MRLARRALARRSFSRRRRRPFSVAAAPVGRIIRFVDGESGAVRLGEPVDTPDGSDQWTHALVLEGDILGPGGATRTGATATIARVLSPLAGEDIPAIFCIGLNYRAHAEETGHDLPAFPIFSMQNPGCVSGPGDPIVVPPQANWPDRPEADYETELAFVVGPHAVTGAPCKNVAKADALRHVVGFACANDVSARRWQGPKRGGGQWCRSKSFDTFLPFGPCLATPRYLAEQQPGDGGGSGGGGGGGGGGEEAALFDPSAGDPADGAGLRIFTELNGATVQDSSTADMIFDVPTLVSFLSEGTTLLPGTVIITGTPSGVGYTRRDGPNGGPLWLRHGDTVTVGIAGIGALTNQVVEE